MSQRLESARAYEKALFAGRMDEVGSYFTDDIVYWVAGAPPIGGERAAVFSIRVTGRRRRQWIGPRSVRGNSAR